MAIGQWSRASRDRDYISHSKCSCPSIFSRPRRRTAFRGPAITQKNSTRAVSVGGSTSYTFADIQPKDIHAQNLSQRPLLAPRQIVRSRSLLCYRTQDHRVQQLSPSMSMCGCRAGGRYASSISCHREQHTDVLDVHEERKMSRGRCSSPTGT